ncbi:MAG TPA: PEGA domain-containing protein [Kofleriaceae bacterium]|jgi:TolB-like protein|nr:PEGA domain-containing protein [Kofleriaceae bacterium]
MSKALSSACLAFLICLGGSAWAKPKIAVLGLEVVPGPTGAVDPEATQVARDLTKELRQRVQSAVSPYVIAPNSSKELTDEKLLMSCDNEAVSCMVVIGVGLAADMLLYGHVERKGDVYRVSLKLLDVKAKSIQAGGDEMPVGGSVTGVSKRIYVKLIGDLPSPGGTLVVKARSQTGVELTRGAVMVDEERKGTLASGKLTLTGIAEGRHTVAIEAGGYQRFEAPVTVRSGEQVSLDARLLEKVAPPAPEQNTLAWKISLGASLGLTVAGAGFAAYSYFVKVNGQLEPSNLKIVGEVHSSISSDDCSKDYNTILKDSNPKIMSFNDSAFRSACTWKQRTYLGYIVGGVGLLGAVTSLIMLSRDTDPSEQPTTGTRSKKPDIAFVPMWMPDGGGASFSVRW